MPATKPKTKLETNGTRQRIEAVASILEGYAQRGVFRGFSPAEKARQGKAVFRLLWHRDRIFEFVFDPSRNSMSFPSVLPNVSAEMHRDLKAFIKARHSAEFPEHRRVDSGKAQITTSSKGGNFAITLRVIESDDEYGTRKLIHLVHEIFLTFLLDGRYYDYMVEHFDLDPDRF
ncbi:MAG: hypothetical protein SF097_18780 [Acidobacteriota bacterium]|nr:hypothetical protein [Acidobacteriota bacterium]